jgi:hypothetical protein
VAAKHQASFEIEQEVLPDGTDALEPAAVQPLCELQRRRPRMGRLDGDDVALESAEAIGSPMEGVALGHL